MTRRLIADSGIGVACEADELEPPPEDVIFDAVAALANVVVGVVDARLCVVVVDVSADEVLEASTLPFVVVSAVLDVVERAAPEEGVSVDCEPLDCAAVRPETLCACVDVPVEPWM